jgi:ABC-type lipoprotein export system ATPase subunit
MSVTALDDIEAWSNKLTPWRRDCLRRLAISNDLSDMDLAELLAMIRSAAGLDAAPPPAVVPFTKAHFGTSNGPSVVLKGVANVQNVNRLLTNASLSFCPKALTIVYGRNGSGKSGFVRILRTACRTRVDSPAKLKVLADVYGSGSGQQSADILVDIGAGDTAIAWKPGMVADPLLAQVAVFDTQSAQLYVDGGNQIRYLPFGLALPHRLNSVTLTLKEKIDNERAVEVGNKLTLATIAFPISRETKAQQFCKSVTAQTTDASIDEETSFSDDHEKSLAEVSEILAVGAAAVADLSALIGWISAVALECQSVLNVLSDTALAELTNLQQNAVAARHAAVVAAGELFTDEPLPGVGNNTWRTLWAAARDYSMTDAFPEQEFPVVETEDGAAACVLCQQPLQSSGAARMERFRKYMDDTLDAAANVAEQAVKAAEAGLPTLEKLGAQDFAERLEQIRLRDAALADSLASFQKAASARRADAVRRLAGDAVLPVTALTTPITEIQATASKFKSDRDVLSQAGNAEERQKHEKAKAELEDRKILSANSATLTTRRDLLKKDAAYSKALADLQTKSVTQKANELLDTHLTTAVTERFNTERARFDIQHLKVSLARKSAQTKAEFEIDPQTKIAKVTSEILSEGEQRALALAGFLTEVALTDGSGPIVVDDPVSSLDRDRSVGVADRLAEEVGKRQVIVFTHDIVFFNELCRAADERSITPVVVALFSDKHAAGKVDSSGMVWKGLSVARRIGQLKNDSAALDKLHATSPASYEVQIKNLYGRLRDTYERVVEEVIFHDIVRRGVDVIQTQLLRYVTLSDALAVRFHEGMTRANTHSHDNPASDTVPVPPPAEFKADIAALEKLIGDMKAASATAESARPQMKLKAK